MIIPGPLDTAALERDLQNSYEGKIAPPDLPKRQTRWQQPASKPIFDLAEVPKGWNSLEPDLDPDDLVSQIARCRERISDNIMSPMFEFKLDDLLKEKKRRDAMMDAEPVGLSWPVVLRLDTLTMILESLREKDECDLVGTPRPFKWDEFDFINAKHDGVTAFMVEGLEGPGPSPQLVSTWTTTPDATGTSTMLISVKTVDLPTRPSLPIEWAFMDDTGASIMHINQSDLTALQNYNIRASGMVPPDPPLMGATWVGDFMLTCGIPAPLLLNLLTCPRYGIRSKSPSMMMPPVGGYPD
ncbi:uncharacterized protein N7525_002339 [Penicillium rubens]|uniref:uncharacterized protein n=1 Tax=Penicillium rubens TaxID=1108849 RepID=UPI002A5A7A54|nr:uncharacterized protein N7525_002339 [Penicillium rubens]KAJ5844598.1 hypothetical protein N7525_002339 [Penicillium rubens]